jgi:hypothetical protein
MWKSLCMSFLFRCDLQAISKVCGKGGKRRYRFPGFPHTAISSALFSRFTLYTGIRSRSKSFALACCIRRAASVSLTVPRSGDGGGDQPPSQSAVGWRHG